jgi:hypothetical protein
MFDLTTGLSDKEVGKAGPCSLCPKQRLSRRSSGRWFAAVVPALLLLVVAFWVSGSALPVQADSSFNTVFSVDEGETGDGPDAALTLPAFAQQFLPTSSLTPSGESGPAAISRPGDDHRIRAPPR